MPRLSDEEKVLQYLLGQTRDGDGRFYLAMNNYSAAPDITPELFIEQLRMLEHDGLIGCVFTARPSPKSTCHVTILTPALTYFEDKKKTKRKRIFNGWVDFIKFLIPTAIAVIALIVSILSYFTMLRTA